MRIAICDDDNLHVEKTVKYIQKWNNRPMDLIISSFNDGDQLIEAQAKHPFDIIILDIYMPMMSGIEVAKEIRTFDKNTKS